MNGQLPLILGMVMRWSVLLGLLPMAIMDSHAEETNAPTLPPVRSFSWPDIGDTRVMGVRVSAGAAQPSEGGSQGLVSLDGSGTSFAATVPLPASTTATNQNEFVVAPIPSYRPTFGWGLAFGTAYIYRPESVSADHPPWVTGLGAFYTDNGSWGGGAAHKMNWDEDQWRLLGALAYADLRYDFYGVGEAAGRGKESIPLRQTAGGGVLELLRGVGGHWYVGGRYTRANVQTGLDGDVEPLPPAFQHVPFKFDSQLSGLGLRVQRDTRDSTFYPTSGSLLDFDANFFASALGSDFEYQSYVLAYNHYFSIATHHVLAVRGYGQATGGDAPFFALASFGSGADLRGYTPGRYRDKLMVAAQAEYRWRVTSRIGVVAFGGAGSVAPEIGEFERLLPSIGFGFRFVIAKENNVSMRFDAAWGRDEHSVYIGVGEAF